MPQHLFKIKGGVLLNCMLEKIGLILRWHLLIRNYFLRHRQVTKFREAGRIELGKIGSYYNFSRYFPHVLNNHDLFIAAECIAGIKVCTLHTDKSLVDKNTA